VRRLLLLLALVLAPRAATIPPAAEQAIEEVTADELRAHVVTLAADDMNGRGVGDAGNQRAEAYIAEALKRAGVAAAVEGYLQPVEVYRPALGRGRLTVTEPDRAPLADLEIGDDFYPLEESADGAVTGPLVDAGYGLAAPRWHHDDYATIQARGAILLVRESLPDALASARLSEDERAELSSVGRKINDARDHGAVGILLVQAYMTEPRAIFPEHPSIRAASFRLLAPLRAAPMAVAAISERAASPIRRALAGRRPLTAALTPGVVAEPIVIHNVLGLIEGREPARHETVVVGAHLDHDGTDEAGRIYNGADDNASGTAAVLAMSAAFARAAARGERPARAVVFALWNGEEKGELGAEYYVTTPMPPRHVAANVNLDMVGRNEEILDPMDPRFTGFSRITAAESANVVHVLGYSYSPEFARMANRANESVRLTIKEDYDQGAQHLVARSDNWPFLSHGVPALFLTTGLHPDYHTPDDDSDRIDYRKLERITELAARLVWIVADGDAPRIVKAR
jgi:Peptidase family M28